MTRMMEGTARTEILEAYWDYFRAYSERDWEGMTARFSDALTMIGTGVDEMTFDASATRALFQREFEQVPAPMTFQVKRAEVFSLAPGVALVVILMDMVFQRPGRPLKSENNRTSAVMVREAGVWKIIHGHWSQPDADQDVGESLPDRLLEEKNRRLEALVAERTRALSEQHAQLVEALAKVRTLKGILPICVHCKSIRHDRGYWTRIEQYITEYTDAFFSHSVCPDCAARFYADVMDDAEGSSGSPGSEEHPGAGLSDGAGPDANGGNGVPR